MAKIKNSRFYIWFISHPILVMIFQLVMALGLFEAFTEIFYFLVSFEMYNIYWVEFSNFGSMAFSEIAAWLMTFIISLLLGYRGLYQKPVVGFKTRWLLAMPFVLYVANIFVGNWFYCMYQYTYVRLPISEGMLCILTYAFVGLYEELECRGLVLNICLKHLPQNTMGMWTALIISSLIFGGGHIANYLNGGALLGVLHQMIFATGLGMLLGAIYLRTRSLLLVSILHGVYDFSLSLEEGFFKEIDFYESFNDSSWLSILPAVPCVILAILMLRKGYECVKGVEISTQAQKVISNFTFGMFVLFVFSFGSFILYYTGLTGMERREILINLFGY